MSGKDKNIFRNYWFYYESIHLYEKICTSTYYTYVTNPSVLDTTPLPQLL